MGVPLNIPDAATLVTNKLVALTDRRSAVARDLFDVWYLLTNNFSANKELIKERTSMFAPEYYEHAAAFIKKTFNKRNVMQSLGEALDDKQKAWVREHLIDETIKEIGKLSDI